MLQSSNCRLLATEYTAAIIRCLVWEMLDKHASAAWAMLSYDSWKENWRCCFPSLARPFLCSIFVFLFSYLYFIRSTSPSHSVAVHYSSSFHSLLASWWFWNFIENIIQVFRCFMWHRSICASLGHRDLAVMLIWSRYIKSDPHLCAVGKHFLWIGILCLHILSNISALGRDGSEEYSCWGRTETIWGCWKGWCCHSPCFWSCSRGNGHFEWEERTNCRYNLPMGV